MRTVAAIILIVVGGIGVIYLGFVALFAVGAIGSDAHGVRSQVGALLVTATPIFCGAAAWCGGAALRALVGRDAIALRAAGRALGYGAALLGLAFLCLEVGGPVTRLS